ncbi:DUF1365 domain-containing protein [Alphaproteobacteria bacterium]|nr:DUF1365 domain-containing protein [Alphaproteobacteria bacterium]
MKVNSQKTVRLFKGVISHKRSGQIEHKFNNRVISILLDLKSNNSNLPMLFSINKMNILSWSASDHGLKLKNSERNDLYKFIINLISKSGSNSKEIRTIKLLTFPKIVGYGFNPLSVYFCYNSKDILNYSIFEVRNTFGDIHHYILNKTNKSEVNQKVLKKLFVSPFYTNKGYYNLHANYLKDIIITSVEYTMNNNTVFFASMKVNEISFTNLNILKSIFNLNIYPGKIWLNIHFQAFCLWLKKVKLQKIPRDQKVKYSLGINFFKKNN